MPRARRGGSTLVAVAPIALAGLFAVIGHIVRRLIICGLLAGTIVCKRPAVAAVICARIDHNPDNNGYIAAEAARHPDRLIQFADVDSDTLLAHGARAAGV